MKKKLVTGATAVQVKGDDIAKLNTTNVLGALQVSLQVCQSFRLLVSRVNNHTK